MTAPLVGPVTDDDVVSGCVRYLLAQPAAVAAVGSAGTPATPNINQDVPPPVGDYAGSQAVVVSWAGPWGSPSDHNTVEFPRIQVEFYIDAIRDATGAPDEPAETRRRLFATWRAFDRLLHRPQHGTVWWGTVRTLGCDRLGDLAGYEIPGSGGQWRGSCFYGVQIG